MGLPSNGFLSFFKSNINELQRIHMCVIHKNEVYFTIFRKNAPKAQTKECHCDSLGSLRIAFTAHCGHSVM